MLDYLQREVFLPHRVERTRLHRGVVAMVRIGRDVHRDERVGQTVRIFRLQVLRLDDLDVQPELGRFLVARYLQYLVVLLVRHLERFLYVGEKDVHVELLIVATDVVDVLEQDLLVQLLDLARGGKGGKFVRQGDKLMH